MTRCWWLQQARLYYLNLNVSCFSELQKNFLLNSTVQLTHHNAGIYNDQSGRINSFITQFDLQMNRYKARKAQQHWALIQNLKITSQLTDSAGHSVSVVKTRLCTTGHYDEFKSVFFYLGIYQGSLRHFCWFSPENS